MNPALLLARRTLAVAMLVAAYVGPRASAEIYIVTDLSTQGVGAGAFSINAAGHIAGATIASDTAMRAFFWNGGAAFVEPAAANAHTFGFAVDDSDAVAAVSYDLGGVTPRGLLWQDGVTTDLGPLAPRGLNNSGAVVGNLTISDASFGHVEHAARWTGGETTDLGTLGGHFSYAFAIDEAGWVVGAARLAGNLLEHPCLWINGTPRDLGTLGGTQGQAYDINEWGEVVGWASNAAGVPHAFIYTLDASGNVLNRTDLGVLPGSSSFARGINNHAEVVGVSDGRAVRWHNGVLVDLNTVIPTGAGWQLDAAWAINDAGQIVGIGARNGVPASFLLTPALRSDVNCDGRINFFDIDPFVLALFDPSGYAAAFPACNIALADANGDGQVDFFDIDPFLNCLFGAACP